MSVIRLCSSPRVFVGFEVFGPELTGVGEVVVAGGCEGAATGLGRGIGEGLAVAVDLRSRCALAVKFAAGSIATMISVNNSADNFDCFIRYKCFLSFSDQAPYQMLSGSARGYDQVT